MELAEYDDIIKHLVAIALKQDVTNRRLEETLHDIRSFVQQQGTANSQTTTLVMRIARTLDLIDEKLERLLPPPAALDRRPGQA